MGGLGVSQVLPLKHRGGGGKSFSFAEDGGTKGFKVVLK